MIPCKFAFLTGSIRCCRWHSASAAPVPSETHKYHSHLHHALARGSCLGSCPHPHDNFEWYRDEPRRSQQAQIARHGEKGVLITDRPATLTITGKHQYLRDPRSPTTCANISGDNRGDSGGSLCGPRAVIRGRNGRLGAV
jgi:hypothetical protein